MPVRWPQYNTDTRIMARIHNDMTPDDVREEHPHYVDSYRFWNEEMERIGMGNTTREDSNFEGGLEKFMCPYTWKTGKYFRESSGNVRNSKTVI